MEHQKKVVVVTGGSRGIGRAICIAFADSETQIFFNYASSEASARETEKIVQELKVTAIGEKVNVSSEKEVSDFFNKIISQTGRIDILVNNAGIAKDNLIVRMKDAEWDEVINTNLKGVFLCTKAVTRTMIKQRFGRIINITSIVGITGNAGQSNYSASKAGIIGFTKSCAKELASRNITVNAVAPGYIETDMTNNLSEEMKKSMIEQIPLKRTGKPEEVAAVIKFLASNEASYITGQVIHVSGGLYI
ncbi:MAG: 3-oxoacyl-[acyl-carrier-protein] reductase [Desulfobacterales bacterium]|nr:3-oxoacyl-[acyl-carrier-protein] reductase [Desulfobacterales bacterium]